MARLQRDPRGRGVGLPRENRLIHGEKKQHRPVKNRFFRLDAPFFSFSIRNASARCSVRWWFINF
jgi:hypothetical protein